MKYTGTKSYNKTFRDSEKTIGAIKATTRKVEGLIPGTTYEFRVRGNSVCGESASKNISKMTDMIGKFPNSLRLTNHCNRLAMKLSKKTRRRRANARNVSFETLNCGQFTFSLQLTIQNYLLYSPTDAAPQFL